jgi:Protein of unknown function (DUF3147)
MRRALVSANFSVLASLQVARSSSIRSARLEGSRMLEYALRFLVGGIAVSAFAALGDTLRPKSFAGLFGAAPSIALATLFITLSQKGAPYAALEGRSMIVGAFALATYSWVVCVLLKKFLLSSWTATIGAWRAAVTVRPSPPKEQFNSIRSWLSVISACP